MGCDIHVQLERFWRGQWVGIENNSAIGGVTNRNYARFARLCNVRGDHPEAVERGLPEDPSPLSEMRHEEWGMDAHSVSWEMLRDFVRICLETEYDPENVFLKPDDPRQQPYQHYFGLYVDDDPSFKFEDYRVVFWFDN